MTDIRPALYRRIEEVERDLEAAESDAVQQRLKGGLVELRWMLAMVERQILAERPVLKVVAAACLCLVLAACDLASDRPAFRAISKVGWAPTIEATMEPGCVRQAERAPRTPPVITDRLGADTACSGLWRFDSRQEDAEAVLLRAEEALRSGDEDGAVAYVAADSALSCWLAEPLRRLREYPSVYDARWLLCECRVGVNRARGAYSTADPYSEWCR